MTGQGGAQPNTLLPVVRTDEVSEADGDDSLLKHYRRYDALTLDVSPIGNRAGLLRIEYGREHTCYSEHITEKVIFFEVINN